MIDPIQGIHHITAIASDPQRNLDFYTQVLGLRLVKKTVNFDDPGTYHFYFADETGTPGTVLTFFPWPNARRGKRGLGQVAVTAFAVPQGTLGAWQERLHRLDVTTSAPFSRFDEEVLTLVDPDGLQIELVARPGVAALPAWEQGPLNASMAIRGFAAPTLLLGSLPRTASLIADNFGLRKVAEDGPRTRYAAGNGIGQQVDLETRPSEQVGRNGAGVVHHIAWRTPDDAQQNEWRDALLTLGLEVTPVMDRQYFHSIYFREPGGILFEIATDAPGFQIDEPRERLGQQLRLPPWYESRRAEIERVLPPLHIPAPQENQPGGPR